MTFSILARDPATGALGGASATGNLCVGAWVLRARAGVGISASQGHYPSTIWGEHVLVALLDGLAPRDAVDRTVLPDPGRETRQMLVLNQAGVGAIFSGSANIPEISEVLHADLCAAGNMLSGPEVVPAMAVGFAAHQGSFLRKLLAALRAGAEAGGDARGLMSAAVLIVAEDRPPIDIRTDFAPDPILTVTELADRIEEPSYDAWARALPTQSDPYRT